MKRFYKAVAVEPAGESWRVALDGRPIKTARGAAQVVPTETMARAMAAEWDAQGEQLDPACFPFRDLADYAIDVVAPDRAAAIAAVLRFAESDTLCYRADPDEPLYRRQLELWEPLVTDCEARLGVSFARTSGVLHRAQPAETLARLQAELEAKDSFTLAALATLASLSTSLIVALAALQPGADAQALWAAANAEEDWQAEQWGWEWTAEERRDKRLAEFTRALEFFRLSRTD